MAYISRFHQVNGHVFVFDFTGMTMKHVTGMMNQKDMSKWHKVWQVRDFSRRLLFLSPLSSSLSSSSSHHHLTVTFSIVVGVVVVVVIQLVVVVVVLSLSSLLLLGLWFLLLL